MYHHGKLGRKEEAESFAQLVCPSGSQVLSIDLPEHGERCSDKSFAPWDAVPELENLLTLAQSRWDHISLRATSLGACFPCWPLPADRWNRPFWSRPVLDMERLIRGMMAGACVSEEELRARGEIPVEFGETLSWRYLQYAQTHPLVVWATPAAILYPEHAASPAGRRSRPLSGVFGAA